MPLIVGHRGVAGTHPENTKASINQAISLGLKWIEIDVQPTKDDVLVVCHDHTLERCSNGKGRVDEHTLAELEALDFGRWFAADFAHEPILTLAELLTHASQHSLHINIEVKIDRHDPAHVVTLLTAELERANINRDLILISSFSHDVVKQLAEKCGEYRLGVISDELSDGDCILLAQVNAFSCHLYYKNTTQETVTKLKGLGYQVWCYTVNEPTSFPLLNDVDAIFTDYPTRFL
ncbi:glycerophosphodiester phosphodiesterase family protein [Vibrio tapetis subsp. quintayensis]|uniref:glycerophosphodiester phosphodiesterase family protein n=1 Tax=Vibrio tapetis TaxID=52443 RepID=UPI0025B4AFAB|nr:glycerophosphodiester phosphodiesterase family protein [Vibrio tapetis]MDN3681956.1 glycerophosphodiester phosphodiesterase family protein [Vibrio tapetis subsp. quintayensis]